MNKKIDIQKLHSLVKEIQNRNWKAYTEFAKSGDMGKFNATVDTIMNDICAFPDKNIAKIAKEANDFWICGWAIVANEMNVKSGD